MKLFAAVLVAWLGVSAMAQAPPSVDHLSHAEMLEKAQQLLAKANAGTGSASVKVAEYPNHYTMVALREKNGGAEIHEQFADIFLVLKGEATLTTGGIVINPETTKPGETVGASLTGGTVTGLKEGDFIHIPAGVPHQITLPKGGEFYYFVIKVKEK